MSLSYVLLPFFTQVALTFWLLFLTGRRRLDSIRRGETRLEDIALGQRAWPARAQQAANAYMNQLELPVLFFALAPLAIMTHKDDLSFVALAWIFVVLRAAHAAVHVTSNHVPTRFRLFLAGVFALMLMWLVFAAQILLRF